MKPDDLPEWGDLVDAGVEARALRRKLRDAEDAVGRAHDRLRDVMRASGMLGCGSPAIPINGERDVGTCGVDHRRRGPELCHSCNRVLRDALALARMLA